MSSNIKIINLHDLVSHLCDTKREYPSERFLISVQIAFFSHEECGIGDAGLRDVVFRALETYFIEHEIPFERE